MRLEMLVVAGVEMTRPRCFLFVSRHARFEAFSFIFHRNRKMRRLFFTRLLLGLLQPPAGTGASTWRPGLAKGASYAHGHHKGQSGQPRWRGPRLSPSCVLSRPSRVTPREHLVMSTIRGIAITRLCRNTRLYVHTASALY